MVTWTPSLSGARLRISAAFLALVSLNCLQLLPSRASAQSSLPVIPLPRSVQLGSGNLVLDAHFHAMIDGAHDARLDAAFDRMLTLLDGRCDGIRRAQATAQSDAPATLTLKVAGPGGAVQSVDEDESYKLNVSPQGAQLTAATDVGAMHGMETFLQLVNDANGACQLPAVTIDDAPRFRWRGFMLDVSRHFEPIDVVERTLDGMALAKLNVFHWHLSDDQGFRAESKKYPRLTEAASNGQFYTQEQMKEVVAYARARGIRVVPEFDMPGHSTSTLLAYPEIGAGEDIKILPTVFGIHKAALDPSNEKTYKFIDEFVGEMAQIFPDQYFHIGGDENKGEDWLANPRIAAFMQKQNLKTAAELQAYFNRRVLPILTKHGKRMMGWDEILTPALPKDIVIQSWRGMASLSEATRQGYEGILSTPYYLDAQKTSAEMFLADPVPADTELTAEEQKLILGGEVCMWAEQIHPETVDSRVWPRTLAIAERFWSPSSDRDVNDMYRRLRIAALELEGRGLSHISGPEKLRRNLWGSSHPEALDVLGSVIEPVSFHDRYHAQHTDALSSLDRLVDAVVPDPSSRQEIAREVDAVLTAEHEGQAQLAATELRKRFTQWQEAAPEIEAMAARSPRLSDAGERASQLGALGTMGLEALSYIQARTTPPQGWKQTQTAAITAAEQPSALVRFVFLADLEKLIEAAASSRQP
jgi:hexosaminidase